jgi:hypothetical protein
MFPEHTNVPVLPIPSYLWIIQMTVMVAALDLFLKGSDRLSVCFFDEFVH